MNREIKKIMTKNKTEKIEKQRYKAPETYLNEYNERKKKCRKIHENIKKSNCEIVGKYHSIMEELDKIDKYVENDLWR